jgi:NAD(P)-dependent dehydrogenase (short-subunit alcohol dehydrogenase family)
MADVGPILITGCSSGIGAATAQRLAKQGHVVYATARRPDTLAASAAAGCRTLALDVTDDASMQAAVEAIVAEHGRVGALVNNAGYGEYGAVEDVAIDRVRRQFETNVIGLSRMCQLVLPSMRAAGTGRIVNVGSMGGRMTFPFGGYYHATKHAVEALSDALRYEVAPFGVRVSLIEPGPIQTEFLNTIGETMHQSTSADSPYYASAHAFDKVYRRVYETPLLWAKPATVARTIERAITSAHPLSRYVIARRVRFGLAARMLVPGRAWDALMRTGVR